MNKTRNDGIILIEIVIAGLFGYFHSRLENWLPSIIPIKVSNRVVDLIIGLLIVFVMIILYLFQTSWMKKRKEKTNRSNT